MQDKLAILKEESIYSDLLDYVDFFSLPAGLEDVSGYPALFAELIDRGWNRANLRKLAGGNIIRVMRKAEEV